MGIKPLDKQAEIEQGKIRKPVHISDLYDALKGVIIGRDNDGNPSPQSLGTSEVPFSEINVERIVSTDLDSRLKAVSDMIPNVSLMSLNFDNIEINKRSITSLSGRVVAVENRSLTNKEDIATNKTNIESNDTDISNLQTQVGVKTVGDQDLETRVKTNSARTGNNQGAISNLQSQVGPRPNPPGNNIETRVQAAAVQAQQNRNLITPLTGRVSVNEGKIGTNETNISNNASTIASVRARSLVNQTNVSNVTTRVGTNETNITNLRGRVTTLEGDTGGGTVDLTKISIQKTWSMTQISGGVGERSVAFPSSVTLTAEQRQAFTRAEYMVFVINILSVNTLITTNNYSTANAPRFRVPLTEKDSDGNIRTSFVVFFSNSSIGGVTVWVDRRLNIFLGTAKTNFGSRVSQMGIELWEPNYSLVMNP